MRDIIALACTECKRRNYSSTKNKKKTTERLASLNLQSAISNLKSHRQSVGQ